MNIVQTVKTNEIQIVLVEWRNNWYTTWCGLNANIYELLFPIYPYKKRKVYASRNWWTPSERLGLTELQARKRFTQLVEASKKVNFVTS